MQKMQEQFSVQNGLIFGEPQATQIGLSLFRASCPPPSGPAELFKIAPGNFVFAPLFYPFQARGKMVFRSGENARDGVLGRVASGTRHCRPRYERHFDD